MHTIFKIKNISLMYSVSFFPSEDDEQRNMRCRRNWM